MLCAVMYVQDPHIYEHVLVSSLGSYLHLGREMHKLLKPLHDTQIAVDRHGSAGTNFFLMTYAHQYLPSAYRPDASRRHGAINSECFLAYKLSFDATTGLPTHHIIIPLSTTTIQDILTQLTEPLCLQ